MKTWLVNTDNLSTTRCIIKLFYIVATTIQQLAITGNILNKTVQYPGIYFIGEVLRILIIETKYYLALLT